MADLRIKITNWEKFNPRKDVKHPRWFAMSNRIMEDPKLFSLSAEEWKAWIYILCQASQEAAGEIDIYLAHMEMATRISKEDFLSALNKLENTDVIESVRKRTRPERIRTRPSRDTTLQDTTLQNTTPQDITVPGPPAAVAPVDIVLTSAIWKSYSDAYFSRYKTDPVRNAKVNSQVAQLAKRLGSEAPAVAAFYVRHNKSYYVGKVHEFGICLADAEALRTQWATGTRVTNREAQQMDDAQTLDAQMKRLGGK